MKSFGLSLLTAVLIQVLGFHPLQAQQQAGDRVNNSLRFNVASSVRLPQPLKSLSCLDGLLRVSSENMIFSASYAKGVTGDLEIDTTLVSIDAEMDYVVRHPLTGSLYYTKDDGKGHSVLYELHEKKAGRFETRRVKPSKFSYSIEHPVFSPDGKAMVFSSDCPLGFGGNDLWYSEWSNGQWQYPKNMGHRINTVGDESYPSMYKDFLVYSSNGKTNGRGGYDLYAARLVAQEQLDDTVMMYPIGQCEAYSLESPFCSSDDDILFTVNGDGSGGWWVSRDSTGRETVFGFQGRMDCVIVTGVVSDMAGNRLCNATVTARRKEVADRISYTDCEGNYNLFLQPGESVEMTFSAIEHFSTSFSITGERVSEDRLYVTNREDVSLFTIAVDSVYVYSGFFSGSAGVELSPEGRSRLDVWARFLNENRHLKIAVQTSFVQIDDTAFCDLLNAARVRSVKSYLSDKGVEENHVVVSSRLDVYVEEKKNGVEEQSEKEHVSECVYLILSR